MTAFKGFILTRHWRDAASGTEIEFWLATDAGPRKVVLAAQTSVAFVPARHRDAVQAQLGAFARMQLRPLQLRTFEQEPVIGVYATHFRHLRQLARALAPQDIALLEADVRPHERYLMERFISAGVVIEGGRAQGSSILGCRLRPAADYRPTLKLVSLDIETSQHEDLYSIALDGQ